MASSTRTAKVTPAKTKAKKKPVAPAKEKRTAATSRHKLVLGVDAGNITLADMGYLIANGVEDFTPHPDDADALAILPVAKGRCALRVRIDTAPPVDEHLELDIASGRLFVGDVGNAFADATAWERFLKKTKLLTVRDRRMRSFHTVSDGEFVVIIDASPAPRRA